MTKDEVKAQAQESSAAGSWMHKQCECVLNGGAIEGYCFEMTLFANFLRSLPPLLAYRTEWCIWADDEKLAGAIDFAAETELGHLVPLEHKQLYLLVICF